MFVIDYTLNLGALGLHDASVIGVVECEVVVGSEKHYSAEVKAVVVQLKGFMPQEVTALLLETELVRIRERLINKFIAAENIATRGPEDWPRDEMGTPA